MGTDPSSEEEDVGSGVELCSGSYLCIPGLNELKCSYTVLF